MQIKRPPAASPPTPLARPETVKQTPAWEPSWRLKGLGQKPVPDLGTALHPQTSAPPSYEMSVKITRKAQKRCLGKAEGAFWGLRLLRSLFFPSAGGKRRLFEASSHTWLDAEESRTKLGGGGAAGVGGMRLRQGCGCARDAAVPGMWLYQGCGVQRSSFGGEGASFLPCCTPGRKRSRVAALLPTAQGKGCAPARSLHPPGKWRGCEGWQRRKVG